MGEFGLVARLVARFPAGPGLLLGPGDDAAVLTAPDGRVVASTDLLVDGTHFRRDWSTASEVGRRAAAANLADIAAMGARPTGLLVGLAAPGQLPLNWADELADGIAAEAAVAGAVVAGGDVTACDRLMIAVCALGDLAGRPPVTRAGARPADVVVVVGRLGWAAGGLAELRAGRRDGPLVAAYRVPQVPYRAAVALAEAGATAMIDVSDGLTADLGHLADRSGVGLQLDPTALPVDPPVAAGAARLGLDPLGWVAGGGDDHAFAACLPADRLAAAERAVAAAGWPVRPVGRVVAGDGLTWTGPPPPGPAGHQHFRPAGPEPPVGPPDEANPGGPPR